MELLDKLTILADAAKYDAACTSSGLDRAGRPGGLGSTLAAGCCHSFSADGRCISLLKVLLTNRCVYDCAYCVNRRSSDVRRAAFTPRELAELTIGFYRRNYIEGLFLSSAVWGGPDRTTEAMIEALRLLREEYGFRGYIHAKAIPGADPLLTRQLGLLADRLSVNIELPSEESLGRLAPDKAKTAILAPMAQIRAWHSGQPGGAGPVPPRPPPSPRPGSPPRWIIGATPAGADQAEHPPPSPRLSTTSTSSSGCSTPPTCRCRTAPSSPPPSPSVRPCCGSTGSTRRTGCCGSTTSGPRSCWTKPIPTSIPW